MRNKSHDNSQTVVEASNKKLPEASTSVLQIANVRIRGLRPLLMSSPKEMFATSKTRMKKELLGGTDVDPMAEAERRAYRDKDDNLCIPALCVLANIYTATRLHEAQTSTGKKARGMSTVQKVKGSMNIEPDDIPLLGADGKQVTEYEVNAARVVNRTTKGAVVRYRPQIDEWELAFQAKWNPQLYGLTEGSVQSIIKTGGDIGLLDWRPRFGIFELVSFEVVES